MGLINRRYQDTLSMKLLLVVVDRLDLSSRSTLGVEAVGEPFESELLGQLDTHDTLPEAEHLGVVAEDRTLDGERVVSGDGANARDLVGGDGHAQTCAADEETPVCLAFSDEFSTGDSGVGVGGLVIG